MRVKNINGTSDNTCKCTSWLAHWRRFSGQEVPRTCPELTCRETPTDGAHVQKDGSVDERWYIIPLCKTHNGMKGQSIYVSDSVALVSANVSETCGKG